MLSTLKNANFRIYMVGQSISLIGTFMQITALTWLVWTLTHDEAMVALSGALGAAPVFFLVPFTGSFADRADRRKILIGTQIASGLLAVALAIYAGVGAASVWPVLGIGLLLGIVGAVDFPSQSAFIGDLAGMSNIRQAVALNASMFQLGRTIGPSLGGAVVAAWGSAPAFALNAISFVAVIISLLLVRSQQQVLRSSTGNPLGDFAQALRWLRTQPRLVEMMVGSIFMTLFVFSTVTLFAPLADVVLNGDARVFGYLSSASGIGALLGALFLTPRMAGASRVGRAMVTAVAWSAIWLIALRLAANLPWAMLCVFMVSVTLPVVLAGTAGLIQFMAPPDMRGRVLSVSQMVSFGAQPLGVLFVGFVARNFGVLNGFLVNGICMLIGVAILVLTRPQLVRWTVNRPAARAAEPPAALEPLPPVAPEPVTAD